MDIAADIQAQVLDAAASGEALQITGNGSKTFLGRTVTGKPLQLAEHSGVPVQRVNEIVRG